MARPESIGRFVAVVGGSSLPPVPASILAWYTSSNGTLDSGDARADNYEAVKTWLDSKGSGTLYPLSQGTAGLRPKFRSFGRRGVYTYAAGAYLNQPDIAINKRSASLFVLIDQADQYVNLTGYTRVLFEIVGVGSLRLVETGSGTGVVKWVDGGGTTTTTLKIPAGLSLVGVTLSASALTIWVNDTSSAATALSAGTATGVNLLDTVADAGAWTGAVQDFVIYDIALSAGQKSQLDTWAQSRGAKFLSNTTKIFACTGDSISTYGSSEDLLGFAGQADRGAAVFYNLGLSGLLFSQLEGISAPLDAVYDVAKRCVLQINCGHNDLGAGVAEATVTADRRAFVRKRRDMGWLIIENQVAPSSYITGGEETERVAFNATMASDSVRSYANAVLAVPSELSDYTNLTYFNADQIHWTHAGHAAMLAQGQASLSALLALPVTTLQAEYNFDGDLFDSTVYTRDMTGVNSPTYTTGIAGHQCLVTAASGSKFAKYPLSNAYSLAWYPVTLMLWFKTTASGFNDPIAQTGNGKFRISFTTASGQIAAYMQSAAGTTFCVSPLSYNDGVWHAAAFVVDASGIKLYLSPDSNASNLVLVSSDVWTGTPGIPDVAGYTFNVGSSDEAGSVVINANFQALRIWAEARTLVQLQAEVPYESF